MLDALPDSRFRGRISRMVPTVDRAKATVMTKVKFDEIDPRILPEMSAKVSFLSQEITPEQQRPLVAVHADALAQRDGRTVVFVVRDGKAVAGPGHAGPEGRRPDGDHRRREVRREGRREAARDARRRHAREGRGQVAAARMLAAMTEPAPEAAAAGARTPRRWS